MQNPPQAKPICVTVKEARLETGQFLAGAALVEQEGVERKLFRITLPLGMQIGPGTRVVVDQDQPLSAQYAICTQTGCLSEYQVNADFVEEAEGRAPDARAGHQPAGPGRELSDAARHRVRQGQRGSADRSRDLREDADAPLTAFAANSARIVARGAVNGRNVAP
ncbi:MAG: invasion associated locus B family protein [Xanthobacteraceae bacterium]|nr:invasion associated locus B family protein [Xanthobacteraceae bacterium]